MRYEVHGLENVPAEPCVILAKHQSTWETFFLSGFFEPLSQVVKRELLFVPFFGWAMALLADRHRSQQPQGCTQATGQAG